METPLNGNKIAYFSMEVGIRNDIHTYSGGLGVLAGDVIRSSADLSVPMVAVTLVSRKGYLKQTLDSYGEQQESPEEWDPTGIMELAPKTIEVHIENHPVTVQAWIYEHKSTLGGVVPIFFLDTNVEDNAPEDRSITDSLYGGDERTRLKQEIVLGIGGTRMLDALGFTISKYHMNEGHSALLTLELLRSHEYNVEDVRNHCIFTTHTPVEAGFDKFPYSLVDSVLGNEIPVDILQKLDGQDKLNMTLLALNLSNYQNGVTKAHTEYSKRLFPHFRLRAVTNGVHSPTWVSQSYHKLFDKYIPGWVGEPELLVRIDKAPCAEIWDAHMENKNALLEMVEQRNGTKMDPNVLTIGFARRATGYKRATLIFSDLDRLREISKRRPLQMIFAGKAHPRDISGKQVIKDIFRYSRELKDEMSIVYLENYDMDIASKLTAGVDVWLNNPYPPMEASGTSGMKAAHNGVINFSVLDGWWIEGCIEGVTGWAIGAAPGEDLTDEAKRKAEIDDLFNKLRYIIAPKFYDDRDAWIELMRNSIGKIAYYFNTNRMMRRYITDAYLS
ncbi:MAG: alpha-glucan family phosphorylase [Candidatus Bathyarchaeota archaeon]|nr:alpha-glucan family phosphorylase [Candidatus Bathyarchaeota archaeon]